MALILMQKEVKGSDTDTASNPESESEEEPEQVEEVVTPKPTGPKTQVREPTNTISSLDETKDDTVVRNKQTQTPKQIQTPKKSGFIPTVATPASSWQLPTTTYQEPTKNLGIHPDIHQHLGILSY